MQREHGQSAAAHPPDGEKTHDGKQGSAIGPKTEGLGNRSNLPAPTPRTISAGTAIHIHQAVSVSAWTPSGASKSEATSGRVMDAQSNRRYWLRLT